jgi:uncharacterized protein (DUF2062 family)
VFKRRTRKSYLRIAAELLWPRGGWKRSSLYVVHRIRRLPDPAHRISRGIFAGVFVTFTPLYGLHFLAAWLLAVMIRGNVLAALLATFFGNPVTFPIIAAVSVELGAWMLGLPPVPLPKVVSSFSLASVELWSNLTAVFTSATADWSQMGIFLRYVFVPYAVGGILPGIIAGLVAYYASYPLILSYQRGRIHRLRERFEKRRQAIDAARTHHAPLEAQGEGADGGDKGAKVSRKGTKPREAG